MPWREEALGGFTAGTPWLPLSAANRARAVEVQERDEASLLHFTRRLLALRKAHPALRLGALTDCRAEGRLLTFSRGAGRSRIACLFNLSSDPVDLPQPVAGTPILAVNGAEHRRLPAYGALYIAGSKISRGRAGNE
jgi:alpha-glucosidase